jgi:hypothetical protein
MSRGALAAYLRNAMMCDPECKSEHLVDFADVAAANAIEIISPLVARSEGEERDAAQRSPR